MQSLKTKSSRQRPKSFETETRPETFETETETETRKNGSRDTSRDRVSITANHQFFQRISYVEHYACAHGMKSDILQVRNFA